jgi:hypothetical protein
VTAAEINPPGLPIEGKWDVHRPSAQQSTLNQSTLNQSTLNLSVLNLSVLNLSVLGNPFGPRWTARTGTSPRRTAWRPATCRPSRRSTRSPTRPTRVPGADLAALVGPGAEISVADAAGQAHRDGRWTFQKLPPGGGIPVRG